MMFTLLLLVSLKLLLASPAFAAALPATSCDISTVTLKLPANQTQLVAPTNAPSFIALGVGVQNYTCSSSSTYTSAGAVAELYDISCLAKTPLFATIQDAAYKLLPVAPPSATTAKIMQNCKLSIILGQHYFVTNPITGVGISPKWDFTSSGRTAGNPNAFVIAAKVASIPAPTGSNDVDWLSLKSVQGELATQVFRTDTIGGQPPASCTPGSPPISVKYTSKYWLFGGTVKK